MFFNNFRRSPTPNINIATGRRPDPRRSAGDAAEDRRPRRQRQRRLRGDDRSDAAIRRRLQPATTAPTSASASGMKKTRAYARDSAQRLRPAPADRPARPPRVPAHAVRLLVDRHRRNRSAVEAPTIRVIDAFTSGGAQVAGGQHAQDRRSSDPISITCAAITRIAIGMQIDASRWRSNDQSNYLGTYTFESLEAYEAGTPRSYTRRIGDPNLALQLPAGRALRPGRHPRPPQPDAQRRRALRSADARRAISTT